LSDIDLAMQDKDYNPTQPHKQSRRHPMKSTYVISLLSIMFSSAALADAIPLPLADSGLVTVATGQTAALNVVNVDPDPAQTCSFSMSFIDATGTTVTGPTVVSNLAGGMSTSIAMGPLGAPQQVRAHLDFSQQFIDKAAQSDPMNGCYRLIPTFEVADESGTKVLNTAFVGLPSPTGGVMKIAVCHKPGSPAQKTLVIPTTAVAGHLRHGDYIGACH
jgi:hypothetical protein